MRTLPLFFLIALLVSPLAANKAEAQMYVQVQNAPKNQNDIGDPDSDAAPSSTEPEAVLGGEDSNPDTAPKVAKTTAVEPLPGAHLVAPPGTETITGEENSVNEEDDKWHDMKLVRLQGLNKVTAKSVEIKSNISTITKFGNLEFTAEKCMRGPESEKAENAVLLTIWDEIPGQNKKQIFRGWMFSSSPAVSALEHPIYDIILLGCGEAPKAAAPAVPENKKIDSKKSETKKPKGQGAVI